MVTGLARIVRRRPGRRAAGFTLVELLVVVAIIGILIALLLPALSGAKEATNKVACGANLNQIYKSMQLYVATFGKNSQFPHIMPDFFKCLTGSCSQAHSKSAKDNAILKGSDDVFKCPSNNDPNTKIAYQGPTSYTPPNGGNKLNYISDSWSPTTPVCCDIDGNHRDGGNVLRFDSSVRFLTEQEYKDAQGKTVK